MAFPPPRPSIQQLDNYSQHHAHWKQTTKGDNKLREKSRASWLSRDKTRCLKEWQVCGPVSEKKQVVKRKWPIWPLGLTAWCRGPPCPALLWPLTSLLYVPWHLCHIFRVYKSPHEEVKEILENRNKHRRISKLPRTKNSDHHKFLGLKRSWCHHF